MIPNQKQTYTSFKEDQRITKIGKIIRQTSIDELPQFFNVFIGDMSLLALALYNRSYRNVCQQG